MWTFLWEFACEERGLSYQLCESLSGTLVAICFFTLQVLYPARAVFLWVILPIPPQESRPPLLLPILSFPPSPWSRTTLFLNIVVLCWSFKPNIWDIFKWIFVYYMRFEGDFSFTFYLFIVLNLTGFKPTNVITAEASCAVFILQPLLIFLLLLCTDLYS